MTIFDSRKAFRVLLAVSPLIGALLFNTVQNIPDLRNGSGNSIQAIVVDDAFPESSGIRVTFLGKAGGVARSGVAALFLTILEGSKAFGVSSACVELVFAVLFNALLRSGKDKSS